MVEQKHRVLQSLLLLLRAVTCSLQKCCHSFSMYQYTDKLVVWWLRQTVVSGDMDLNPAACWNSLQPLRPHPVALSPSVYWHVWRSTLLYCCALYNFLLLKFSSFQFLSAWQWRTERVVTLNMNILPFVWHCCCHSCSLSAAPGPHIVALPSTAAGCSTPTCHMQLCWILQRQVESPRGTVAAAVIQPPRAIPASLMPQPRPGKQRLHCRASAGSWGNFCIPNHPLQAIFAPPTLTLAELHVSVLTSFIKLINLLQNLMKLLTNHIMVW